MPRASALSRPRLMGSGRQFELEVRLGAGAYICGEETSDAREPRGQARRDPRAATAARPSRDFLASQPLSTTWFTLASIPIIPARGASTTALGTGKSRGTLPRQLAGNVRACGLIERRFRP